MLQLDPDGFVWELNYLLLVICVQVKRVEVSSLSLNCAPQIGFENCLWQLNRLSVMVYVQAKMVGVLNVPHAPAERLHQCHTLKSGTLRREKRVLTAVQSLSVRTSVIDCAVLCSGKLAY